MSFWRTPESREVNFSSRFVIHNGCVNYIPDGRNSLRPFYHSGRRPVIQSSLLSLRGSIYRAEAISLYSIGYLPILSSVSSCAPTKFAQSAFICVHLRFQQSPGDSPSCPQFEICILQFAMKYQLLPPLSLRGNPNHRKIRTHPLKILDI